MPVLTVYSVAVDINILEIIVESDCLNLIVGVEKRAWVPQSDVVHGIRVLLDLLRSGVVTYEEAIAKTSNPTEFDQTCLKLGLRKRS